MYLSNIFETLIFSIIFSLAAKYVGKFVESKFKHTDYYTHLIANILLVHIVILLIKRVSQVESYSRAVFVPFSFILFSVQPTLKKKLLE